MLPQKSYIYSIVEDTLSNYIANAFEMQAHRMGKDMEGTVFFWGKASGSYGVLAGPAGGHQSEMDSELYLQADMEE